MKNFFAPAIANSLMEVDSWKGGGGMGGIGGKGTHVDYSHGYTSGTPAWTTLQRQNAENLKQIFPENEYRGSSPNFHIHVSVSELYIPTMVLPVLLEEICRLMLGIYKSLRDT